MSNPRNDDKKRNRLTKLDLSEARTLQSSVSSASLSEKLPENDVPESEDALELRRGHMLNEIQHFKEELKAGVTTISGFWNEFKDYIESGDILDHSLSMVAGQAFTELMNSFVIDLVVPVFATLIGRPNVTNLFLILKSGKDIHARYRTAKEARQDGASIVPFGRFLQKAINFVFLGFTLVLFVRLMRTVLFFRQRVKKENEERKRIASEKDCQYCLSRISIAAIRCPNCTSYVETKPGATNSIVSSKLVSPTSQYHEVNQ